MRAVTSTRPWKESGLRKAFLRVLKNRARKEVTVEEHHRTRRKRWDWIGDERLCNKMITDVRKATAHVVRYGQRSKPCTNKKTSVEKSKIISR